MGPPDRRHPLVPPLRLPFSSHFLWDTPLVILSFPFLPCGPSRRILTHGFSFSFHLSVQPLCVHLTPIGSAAPPLRCATTAACVLICSAAAPSIEALASLALRVPLSCYCLCANACSTRGVGAPGLKPPALCCGLPFPPVSLSRIPRLPGRPPFPFLRALCASPVASCLCLFAAPPLACCQRRLLPVPGLPCKF
jgi:hypothetical protein